MHGLMVVELMETEWGKLTGEERQVIEDWLKDATVQDLYMLCHQVRRRARRRKTSSSQTFEAVKALEEPDEAG